jgi:hypothetical protein
MENPSDDELSGVAKLTPKEEAWHKEQFRKSHDLVRVYNPTDKDFKINWDGNIHVVPAKSEKTLIYYVAVKYCRDMKDQLINQRNDEALTKEIASRFSKGFPEWTPYDKQTYLDKLPKTDNEKLVSDIYNQLWLGVEEEFGLDATDEASEERLATIPVEEKVLATMNRRYQSPKSPSAVLDASQEAAMPGKQKKIAEEVSE